MTPNTDHAQPYLQDAILELLAAEKLPDADLVEGVVHAYPEFAVEITEFAVNLAIDMLINPVNEAELSVSLEETSPMVARAMSNFENELFEKQQSSESDREGSNSTAKTSTINPFARMDRTGFRAFATAIHASTIFAMKIRDHQIKLATIPLKYLEMIAQALPLSLEQLRDYLNHRNGRLAPGNQFFKADDKPDHNIQQSFDEAVATSGLTEEQQNYLLSLK